jgi:ribosomal protein S27AE
MAAFTEIKREAIKQQQWHCPYCGRENFEPTGQYEDECNLLVTMYNFIDDNIVTFRFECPQCERHYEEDYKASYISTIGEKGTFDSHLCQQCGTDREDKDIIPDGWYYFDALEKKLTGGA